MVRFVAFVFLVVAIYWASASPRKEMPPLEVCGPNEVFSDCGTLCPPICGAISDVMCAAVCRRGCVCREGYIRSEENGRCISNAECRRRLGQQC